MITPMHPNFSNDSESAEHYSVNSVHCRTQFDKRRPAFRDIAGRLVSGLSAPDNFKPPDKSPIKANCFAQSADNDDKGGREGDLEGDSSKNQRLNLNDREKELKF